MSCQSAPSIDVTPIPPHPNASVHQAPWPAVPASTGETFTHDRDEYVEREGASSSAETRQPRVEGGYLLRLVNLLGRVAIRVLWLVMILYPAAAIGFSFFLHDI